MQHKSGTGRKKIAGPGIDTTFGPHIGPTTDAMPTLIKL
jgi:hypothetical protein